MPDVMLVAGVAVVAVSAWFVPWAAAAAVGGLLVVAAFAIHAGKVGRP